jgi:hypothetical protein
VPYGGRMVPCGGRMVPYGGRMVPWLCLVVSMAVLFARDVGIGTLSIIREQLGVYKYTGVIILD